MRLYGSFPRAWKHTVSMSANVHRTCGHCDRFADCTPVRLRVVPFSLSPSLRDAKEILGRNAWVSRPLPGSSRGHFCCAVFFRVTRDRLLSILGITLRLTCLNIETNWSQKSRYRVNVAYRHPSGSIGGKQVQQQALFPNTRFSNNWNRQSRNEKHGNKNLL